MSAPVVDPSQPRFGCYVGNIDSSITLQMFREIFTACGPILDCSLNGSEDAPYRYGFIDFATEDDRSRALKYNGFTFSGRKLKVMVSRGNVGKPEGYGGSGGGGGGFRQDRERRGPRYDNGEGGYGAGPNAANNGGAGGGGGQSPAQLLLQLIAQGAIDVRNLTPEQQQQVFAAAMGNGAAPPQNAGQTATPPVQPYLMPGQMGLPPQGQGMMAPAGPMPPQQGYMMPAPQGPYGAQGMWMPGAPGAYDMGMMPSQPTGPVGQPHMMPQHAPVNPLPSEQTLKLRELQRKQYFDVVREQAQKYQQKYGAKDTQKTAEGHEEKEDRKSEASSHSSSDNDEDNTK